MRAAPTPDAEHNAACERAIQANCQCFCHGAGHQHDLVERAATCANSTDFDSLILDLERIFGGFHADERDIQTPTRGSRYVPTANEIPKMRFRVG
jgi:hypothetical protein